MGTILVDSADDTNSRKKAASEVDTIPWRKMRRSFYEMQKES